MSTLFSSLNALKTVSTFYWSDINTLLQFLYLSPKEDKMDKKRILASVITLSCLILSGCSKISGSSEEKVELYLLESYKAGENTYMIVENTVKTESYPLISYNDFLYYDQQKCAFGLSDAAASRIEHMKHSVHGVPFVITADREIVYSGYLWPSYSSASCDWIVADPFTAIYTKELTIRLGYPGLFPGVVIPDKRNDKRIIDIFRNDNKLR